MIFDSLPATILVWVAAPVLIVGAALLTNANRRGLGPKSVQRAFLWFGAGTVLLLLGIAVGNLPANPFGLVAFLIAALVCGASLLLGIRGARRKNRQDP